MNSLKPSLRLFRKYPVFSLINLGGLSIGIAASFILLVYTQRELSTDRHFRDADRIARIGTDFFQMGPFAISQPMLRSLAIASCKDVEDATAIDADNNTPVRTSRQDRAFTGISAYHIDSSFFHIFSYEASAGSLPAKGLAPGQAILSATNARKFFGGANSIGQTIYIGKESTPYTVVAVLQESFAKSHLDPQLLLPQSPRPPAETGWVSAQVVNYVKLKPQGSLAGLNTWLERLRQKVIYPASGSTDSYAQWKTKGTSVSFLTEPLTDIYFGSKCKFDLSPGGNLTQV